MARSIPVVMPVTNEGPGREGPKLIALLHELSRRLGLISRPNLPFPQQALQSVGQNSGKPLSFSKRVYPI